MKCLDNSRSRAQHVTHTLKRVYGNKRAANRPFIGCPGSEHDAADHLGAVVRVSDGMEPQGVGQLA